MKRKAIRKAKVFLGYELRSIIASHHLEQHLSSKFQSDLNN